MKQKVKLDEARFIEKRGLKSRARTGTPRFIVIHHAMCASPACTYGTLKKRGLSTHYEVDKDGSIIEYVDPMEVAFHSRGKNVNAKSIGIDITGKGGETTAAQRKSLQALVTRLCQAFSIPQIVAPDGVKFKDGAGEIINLGIGIVRHRNVRNTACPGDFPMNILGPTTDAPLQATFTPKDTQEKNKLKDKVGLGVGGDDKKHADEMAKAGGRFISKFTTFFKEHPDFSFEKFYKDLAKYVEGGIKAALPDYGRDYVFGAEHFNAWNMLQTLKGNLLKEHKNIYSGWREFLNEKDNDELWINWNE